MQQYGVEKKFASVEDCIQGLKQVWCWKGDSQGGSS